jgi:hypothetical protein
LSYSINTFNADKNVFRYKIVGLSDSWSDFESNGRIQLRGVPNVVSIYFGGKNIGTGEYISKKT